MAIEYTKAQLVALNNYLAYFPDGMPYADVLKRLHDDDVLSDDSDDAIDARGDYEGLSPVHLAQLITDLHDYLITVYGS